MIAISEHNLVKIQYIYYNYKNRLTISSISNLHKLYIYIYINTNFSLVLYFPFKPYRARNETPYTFSYLYGNFCFAKLHGYIVARGFLRNVTPHTFTVNRGNLVPILSSRIARSINERYRENNDEK